MLGGEHVLQELYRAACPCHHMGNQQCLAQDPTATYPPHKAHFLALAPLPTWGCVVSSTRAPHYFFLCSSEVLVSPEPLHPSFPSSDVPYTLPTPSLAAKLLTLKGRCFTVQTCLFADQMSLTRKIHVSILQIAHLSSSKLIYSQVSVFRKGSHPKAAGLAGTVVSGPTQRAKSLPLSFNSSWGLSPNIKKHCFSTLRC